MNERIEKLKIESLEWDEEVEAWLPNAEKFAELIVRECADIVADHDVTGMIEGIVLQHFGVEE